MNPSANPSLLGKLIGTAIMAVMLVLGLMFSVVLLAGMLVIGALAFGYFWWKTRALRQALQAQVQSAAPEGQVIEGEAVVIEEWQARQDQARLDDPEVPSSGRPRPDVDGSA